MVSLLCKHQEAGDDLPFMEKFNNASNHLGEYRIKLKVDQCLE